MTMLADPEESKRPLAAPSLVVYLEETFPDRAPDLYLDEKEVWYRAGQVSVVRKLKADIRAATDPDKD